jgi:hypothetical protein
VGRVVQFLPWAAAISVGALAGAFAFVHLGLTIGHRPGPESLTVAAVFPYALAVCAAVGMPVALWFRGARGWVIPVMMTSVFVAAVYIYKLLPHWGPGEAAAWGLAITIFFIIPFGLLVLVQITLCLACVALPAGALVLLISGEIEALRRGVPVFDLPHTNLRFGLLLLVMLAPFASLALPGSPVRPPSPATVLANECRTETPSPLSYHGLQVIADIDQPDWPELKRIAGQFAAANAMQLVPADHSQLGFADADPFQYGLCRPNRLAVRVSTREDMGGRTFLFEPTGDRYVQLTVYSASAERDAERTLRELLAAIDARWPGTRFQTKLDLGPSLRHEKFEPYACRTKIVRRDYQECLGPRVDVRKEDLFVHGKAQDWQRLQDVMRAFAAAHAMAFKPDPNPLPMSSRACGAGTALIAADGLHGGPWPIGPSPGAWGVQIDTWVPKDSTDSAALIDELAATLETEWPGVLRSRPDMDFCRTARAQKRK